MPGGVETDKFHPVDVVEARQRLVWPQKQKIIVCVRRLARRMGLETLIEAFGRATLQHHPDVKLMIGGQGPLREELEQQVLRAGLSRSVQFSRLHPGKRAARTFTLRQIFRSCPVRRWKASD
jgi:phosphatidylinositol alpha-1,6-mannosyltransferase